MSFLDFIPVIGKVLDRIIPDPAAKAAANLELVRLAQAGELSHLDAEVKLAAGQTDINKIEAANPRLFVSGWRPFVGWGCGFGLISAAVLGPFVTWGSALASVLMTTLAGMLGIGGMRTYEKIAGVAAK
jgi:hypothetical protein